MNKETLRKINQLLKSFNNSFEVEANLIETGDEIVASGLKIKSLKNDGSQFISQLYDTFNLIVQNVSDEHEVIYDEEKGIVIARKIVKTNYVIEDI